MNPEEEGFGKDINQNMRTAFDFLKEVSYEDFVKYAVYQCLNSQLSPEEYKFPLAVENLESIMLEDLERTNYGTEKVPLFYKDLCASSYDDIEREIGLGSEEQKQRIIREYAKFKFRIMFKKIRDKMPVEVGLEI